MSTVDRDSFRSSIPPGKVGKYSVTKFIITPEMSELTRYRSLIDNRINPVPAGEYTRLSCGDVIWMTDTPDEIIEIDQVLRNISGKVRLNGLGLGVAAEYVLLKSEVTKVIAVDISSEVIQLVYPTLKELYGEDRIEVRQEDVLKDKPPSWERYDFVLHDIWSDISTANLKEMKLLTRRYGSKTAGQHCWARQWCEEARDRFKKYGGGIWMK